MFGSQSAVARGTAEEIPTPVGGGELELIECTIETCLFVEIKCVHYIANTHTRARGRTHRADRHTNVWGKNCCREGEIILVFFFFIFTFFSVLALTI